MRLEELSKDTAIQLLKNLNLSEAQLEEAMWRELSPELKRTVDLVHTIFCRNLGCLYENESAIETCWLEKEHKDWLSKTRLLMLELDCSCEERLRFLFTALTPALECLAALEETYPTAFLLLKKIRGWELIEKPGIEIIPGFFYTGNMLKSISLL
jgi:hypothetical protein